MTEPTPDAEPLIDPTTDDPDIAAAVAAIDEPDDPGALATDELGPDPQDDGWEAPDTLSTASREGFIDGDPERSETLDDRLAQEVPEPDPSAAGRADADHDLRET